MKTRLSIIVTAWFVALLACHLFLFELRYAWFLPGEDAGVLRRLFLIFALAIAANFIWLRSALLAFALSISIFLLPPIVDLRYVRIDAGYWLIVIGQSLAWASLAMWHRTRRGAI